MIGKSAEAPEKIYFQISAPGMKRSPLSWDSSRPGVDCFYPYYRDRALC